MPNSKPQPEIPRMGNRIAVGADEMFTVVLVETNGALGVLVAERRGPNETLERVLYFRSLMGEPYARFFETVELLTVGKFSAARSVSEDAIFFEPSLIPYATENISRNQYECFVDDVVDYRCDRAELFITSLFSTTNGFSMDSEGRLAAPPNYANAMDQFMGDYSFVDPHQPINKNQG